VNRYKFIKYIDKDNEFDTTKVIHIVETENLNELLEAFEVFLKGCQFGFRGVINIVNEEV
jgi:hypothetical protein